MLLGFLLGNTSLRYGVLDGSRIVSPGSIAWERLDEERGKIGLLAGNEAVEGAVAGSVRDDFLPRLHDCLPDRLRPVRLARLDFPLPIVNRYENAEEVGTDRLLNAIGARERAAGRGAIVADFGTAVSISVVGADGAFEGGLIAAGGGALAAGLAAATPRLPPVRALAPGAFLQRSTLGALSSGLFWEVAGGVSAMLRGLLAELRLPRPLVLATGGGAPLFAPHVELIEAVVPDLGLEGLLVASRRRG